MLIFIYFLATSLFCIDYPDLIDLTQYSKEKRHCKTTLLKEKLPIQSEYDEIENWNLFKINLNKKLTKYWNYQLDHWLYFQDQVDPLDTKFVSILKNFLKLKPDERQLWLTPFFSGDQTQKIVRASICEAEKITNYLYNKYSPLMDIECFNSERAFPVLRMDRRAPYEIFRVGGFDKINKNYNHQLSQQWLLTSEFINYNENRLVYTSTSLEFQIKAWDELGGNHAYIYIIYSSCNQAFFKKPNMLKAFEKIHGACAAFSLGEEVIFPHGINFYDVRSVYDIKRNRILHLDKTFRKHMEFNSLVRNELWKVN